MKTPICQICLKSGILCAKCQERFDAGLISPLDLEISRLLLKLENQYPSVKKIYLQRTTKVGNMTVLQVSKESIPILLTSKASVIRYLEKQLRTSIRVIEYTKSPTKVAQDLLYPARIAGVNTIYLPDGTNEVIIRVLREDEERLPSDTKLLREAIEELTGRMIRIELY